MIVILTHVNMAAYALTLLMITNVNVPALVLVEATVNWVCIVTYNTVIGYHVTAVLFNW